MARSLDYYLRLLRWSFHYLRPEHEVSIETANGLLSVSSKDWLVGKHLFVRRNYEFDYINKSVAFLQRQGLLKEHRNRTVVDLGANLGMICIALLRDGLFKNAIAFEPAPRNFRLLKRNVSQNGFAEAINCYPVALTSENGQITLELAEDNSGDCRVRSTNTLGELGEHRRKTVIVEAKTFDSFLEENSDIDSNAIDLLWVDIQGHDGYFFKGAKDFFRKKRVAVENEFWGYGINRSGMSKDEYCRILGGIFSEFYHYTGGSFKLQSISEIEKLFDLYRKPREIANIILV